VLSLSEEDDVFHANDAEKRTVLEDVLASEEEKKQQCLNKR
jgi:hypothetical protein